MFLSGSVQTADHRKVLTVNFGVALIEKEAPATRPGEPGATRPMSFLDVTGRRFSFLVWPTGRVWRGPSPNPRSGRCKVVYSVRSEERKKVLADLLRDRPVYVCDVEQDGAADRLGAIVGPAHGPLAASCIRSRSPVTPKASSRFTKPSAPTFCSHRDLLFLARGNRPRFPTPSGARRLGRHIGISSLLITPDNYGYMGPIKAALESTARFLAKSFSAESEIRFNVVGSGP